MRIAVAICTWNRSALLRATLDHMVGLVVPPKVQLEIVVVDNNSTDETPAVAESFQSRLPIRYLVAPEQGISHARNKALDAIRADYIVFTDDDVLVDRAWLLAFADAADRNRNVAAFGGPIDPWFPVDPEPDLAAAFPALARGFCGLDRGDVERILEPHEDVTGANMAFRCASIVGLRFRRDLGTKGSETIGGDELEFLSQIRRQGGQILWVPTMKVQHYVDPKRMTLDYLLKFAEDGGRREIRLHGIPEGARFAGVPRWLVRRMLECRLQSIWNRVLGRRADALRHLGKSYEFAGRAKEARVEYLRARHTASASTRDTSTSAP